MPSSNSLMIRSNTLYDKLKFATQIGLPALGTLYFTLSQIWGFPSGEEVVGTIVAVTAFLGVMLGVSTANYNRSDERFDGSLDVIENQDKTVFSLNIDGDPYKLGSKDEITLRVQNLD